MNPEGGLIHHGQQAKLDRYGQERDPLPRAAHRVPLRQRDERQSRHTVKWYDDRLELFERFLGAKAVLADLTVANVRAFIAELQARDVGHGNNRFVTDKAGPLSSSYIQGFARALRAFSSWLYEDTYTETNVLKTLKPPGIAQKVIEVLTEAEIRRLLASFDRDDPFGARNHANVLTLLDCGLRASELCGLTVANAHIEEGLLKVLGKGNKERLVPIGQSAQATLRRWSDRFRPQFLAEPEAP
jgi:integrase/recombinase XerD